MDDQKLLKLRLKWYSKLRRKGFKDIEGTNGLLKSWSSHNMHGDSSSWQLWKRSQLEYYRLGAQFLFDKEFPDKHYKRIWKLHVNGKSYCEIGRRMDMPEEDVRYRIRKMRALFFKRKQ